MTLTDKIARKESSIKALPDQRWYRLITSRRPFVEKEKEQATGKPFEDDLRTIIDQGYLNLLDCILKIAR